MKNYIYNIVSHTHWDREWYLPFETFRNKLVDLIDSLLQIIDSDSAFIFHLDAQTVVLEDYLAIRPEKKEILCEYIRRGNIVVGPWYLQNDFYLTDGEATIRNLLIGTELAREFGKCSEVGYAPDQFGNISQLPQILSNFGIQSFVFGRGYTICRLNEKNELERLRMPTEFLWEGADGSRIFAIHLQNWYNNAQRFPVDADEIMQILQYNAATFDGLKISPYILLMNGVDHLFPQDDLKSALRVFHEKYPDIPLRQVSLDEHVEQVQDYISEGKEPLDVFRGELKYGTDIEILKNCGSTKIEIKQKNFVAQNFLISVLEPVAVMLELQGFNGVYDRDKFRYLWKMLIKNHPHDSICSCSGDAVLKDIFSRFDHFFQLAKAEYENLISQLQLHLSVPDDYQENYIITVINPFQKELNKVLRLTVRTPKEDKIQGFCLIDSQGIEQNIAINSIYEKTLDIFSRYNLTGAMDVRFFEIEFSAHVAPFSVGKYFLLPNKEKAFYVAEKAPSEEIENEFYKIQLTDKGVCIKDKSSDKITSDALYFESVGEIGDTYVSNPLSEIFRTSTTFSRIICTKTVFTQKLRFKTFIEMPAGYDFQKKCRLRKRVKCGITCEVELREGDKNIYISYEIDNKATDHKLFAVVRTGLKEARLFADTPFDIIEHKKNQYCAKTKSDAFYNSGFIALEENECGKAVFTNGQYEFERRNDEIRLALLKSVRVIFRNDQGVPNGGEIWDSEMHKELGLHSGKFVLRYYTGNHISEHLPLEAKISQIGLLGHCAPIDRKKINGGRFVVQGTMLPRIYFEKDCFAGLHFEDRRSLLKIDNADVIVTAFKKHERKEEYVLRLCNTTDTEQAVRLDFGISVSVSESDMSERDKGEIDPKKIKFKRKEIKTFIIRAQERNNTADS